MGEDFGKFEGEIEIDESYYGGKSHGGRVASNKTSVFGIVNRNTGEVEARKVANVKHSTILPIGEANVSKDAKVFY